MPSMTLSFRLPYRIKADQGWYVASCPSLDVHSQGKSQKQAKDNLREALLLFLTSCIERGTLDEVLKDRKVARARSVPSRANGQRHILDIPVHLIAGRGHAQAHSG